MTVSHHSKNQTEEGPGRFARVRPRSLVVIGMALVSLSVAAMMLIAQVRSNHSHNVPVATVATDGSHGAAFLAENAAAMKTMMEAMHPSSTGDVDLDFVAMMVPHHQGAIDMAIALLRYGRNPQLKRIAQEIIIIQRQEIAVMLLAIGRPLPAAAPPTSQIGPVCRSRS